MSEPVDLLGLVAQPANRRCWLLFKALESLPLDQAVYWARTAEAFIAGTPFGGHTVTPDATPEACKHVQPTTDQVIASPSIVQADRHETESTCRQNGANNSYCGWHRVLTMPNWPANSV
jgi:hypothetical protein